MTLAKKVLFQPPGHTYLEEPGCLLQANSSFLDVRCGFQPEASISQAIAIPTCGRLKCRRFGTLSIPQYPLDSTHLISRLLYSMNRSGTQRPHETQDIYIHISYGPPTLITTEQPQASPIFGEVIFPVTSPQYVERRIQPHTSSRAAPMNPLIKPFERASVTEICDQFVTHGASRFSCGSWAEGACNLPAKWSRRSGTTDLDPSRAAAVWRAQ